MLNNIDTLLLSNSTNESHYKVALEEVSKLLENIQEQGDEDLSNFLWKLKTILIIKDRYIKTFFLLKDKKHYEAWVLLERIEIDISFLEKNVDEDFIKNISWISTKRLLRVGNRYFLTKFSLVLVQQ